MAQHWRTESRVAYVAKGEQKSYSSKESSFYPDIVPPFQETSFLFLISYVKVAVFHYITTYTYYTNKKMIIHILNVYS